jgi:hypothetical protein
MVGGRARSRIVRRWIAIRRPELARLLKITEPASLSPQRQQVGLYKETRRVLDLRIPGAFVELGVHLGGGAGMLVEAVTKGQRDIHLFDRWHELPEPTNEDGAVVQSFHRLFVAPTLPWLHEQDLVASVRHLLIDVVGMPADRVHLHQGWIQETLPTLGPRPVAFCHLDLDYYDATRFAFEWLDESLGARGIIVINDWRNFDGVRTAYREFEAWTHRSVRLHIRDGHAVVDIGLG